MTRRGSPNDPDLEVRVRSLILLGLATVHLVATPSGAAAQATVSRRTTLLVATVAAPSGVAVNAVAEGANLSWTGVQGATAYQVFRGSDSVNVTPWGGAGTTTSIVDGSIPAGTIVYYRVAAIYSNGAQGMSGAVAHQAPQAQFSKASVATFDGGKPNLAAPSRGLTLVAPNRAPPTGVTVAPVVPMVARLGWPAVTGAATYAVTRTDASGATVQRTPDDFTATSLVDTVPDARQAYAYRVSAFFPDNGYGQSAPLSFTSPPLANPGWMRATVVTGTPSAVDLAWETRPGTVGYWVRGPGLANGSVAVPGGSVRAVGLTSGIHSWRVVAVYLENAMDTTTARAASAIVRVLPTPAGLFLSRPAGNGDHATATAHATALCDANTVGCGRERLDSATERLGGHGAFNWIEYFNATDFGQTRRAGCGLRSGGIFCWAENDVTRTLIVTTPAGTQFLAFEEAEPGIWRQVSSTRIDGEGRKNLPFSCMACHGGTYDPQTRLVRGATLLPIDPSLVRLGRMECYRGLLAENLCTEQEVVRQINQNIYATSSSQAVRRYIYGLYGGRIDVPGATAVQNYVPQSWQQQHGSFYLDVLRPNCVMCHLAGPANLDFTTQSNFFGNGAAVHRSVCVDRSMPHAELPFKRFWTEDTGNIYVPGLLATLLGYPSC